TVRYTYVSALSWHWQGFNFTQTKFDIAESIFFGVLACFREHLIRHIDADNPATWTHRSRCKNAVESSTRTKIKNGLPWLQRRYCQRISTAKSKVRGFRRHGSVFCCATLRVDT